MYTYLQSEPGLWTVGDYDSGRWNAESDHTSPEAAAKRVHYLNGGRDESLLKTIAELEKRLREANDLLSSVTVLGYDDKIANFLPFGMGEALRQWNESGGNKARAALKRAGG